MQLLYWGKHIVHDSEQNWRKHKQAKSQSHQRHQRSMRKNIVSHLAVTLQLITQYHNIISTHPSHPILRHMHKNAHYASQQQLQHHI